MELLNKTKTAFAAAMLFCFTASATAAGKGNVHIKGQLIDMGTTDVPMRYDGAASMIGNSRDIMLKTDAKGNFDVTISLDKPAYYNISRNTLYLSPGDNLTVRITQNNSEATFSGRGAEANNYMKYRLFPHGGSFLEAGSNIRADFAATKAVIDSLADARRKQLSALKNVSSEFKVLENARIEADILNSLLMYPSYSGLTKGARDRDQLIAAHESFFKTIVADMNSGLKKINDDRFLDVNVARSVLSQVSQPYSPSMEKWLEGVTLTPRAKALFRSAGYVDQLRSDVTPELLKEVRQYSAALPYKDFTAELDAMANKAGKLVKGQPAFDFELTDINGKKHRLSDFKGKAIYLDFWATWCGPCIQESPHFEELAKEFAGRDIVFIPVSTDTNNAAWKRFLTVHKKQLVQYNSTDKNMSAGWQIHYIPRFVLIDKDFKIVSAYAPLPSSTEARTLLKELLGK